MKPARLLERDGRWRRAHQLRQGHGRDHFRRAWHVRHARLARWDRDVRRSSRRRERRRRRRQPRDGRSSAWAAHYSSTLIRSKCNQHLRECSGSAGSCQLAPLPWSATLCRREAQRDDGASRSSSARHKLTTNATECSRVAARAATTATLRCARKVSGVVSSLRGTGSLEVVVIQVSG